MDFFSGLGKKVSKTAKIVGEKTRDGVETSRVNGEIRATRSEIDRLYRAYGEVCYKQNVLKMAQMDLSSLESQIKSKFEQIDLLNARLDTLRDIQRCPECGAQLAKDTRFCGHCGARLPEPEPEPEPQTQEQEAPAQLAFCTECGAPRVPGTRFCTSCGSDFAEMEAQSAAETAPEPASQPEPTEAEKKNEPDPQTEPPRQTAPQLTLEVGVHEPIPAPKLVLESERAAETPAEIPAETPTETAAE